MSEYRRPKIAGEMFLFTAVTFNRSPILTGQAAHVILHSAWLDAQKRFPFQTIAVVLLPNRIHCIGLLPEDDANFSVRWKEIKRLFT